MQGTKKQNQKTIATIYHHMSYQPNFMAFHGSLKKLAVVKTLFGQLIIIFIQGTHSPWRFLVEHASVAAAVAVM